MARRRNPVAALCVVAAVPALLLAGLWQFADGQAGSGTAPPDSVSDSLPPVLDTPALSVRRAPAVLARDANVADFRAALQPLVAAIDSQSCVTVAIDGLTVASANETVPLRPASNVKLVTAAVALDVLGPDFTYTTDVVGVVGDGGVVEGNLAIVGGGDPVLSEAWWAETGIIRYPPFNITSIEALADAVVAAGVTRVAGSVVGDGSRYDDQWYVESWTDDVKAELEALPVSALVVNDLRTSDSSVASDPNAGAAEVLTRLLIERGITVNGSPGAGSAPDGAVVASVQSLPLPAVLAEMLTTSDNLSAEMILKEIGLAERGTGSFAAGLQVVQERLTSWGIPMDGLVFADGSGLSDENRLTCAALAGVLQHGEADDPVGAGLPIGGDSAGTLDDAFTEEPLAGLLRAKTGTLNNNDGIADKPGAKTLSGYVPLDGGGAIEFSLLLNGETITNMTEYRPTWDLLGAALEVYLEGVSVADLAPR